ncbi:MAG TPA: carbohydrate ABC transporter permease [Dongiaceae bacterium]|jgi:multiple sugar transport system permease protein|nr:carbohydrate ABC transporter permease [Dongiaceae bacterium]
MMGVSSRRAKLIQAIWIYSAVTVLLIVTLAPLVWLFLMSVTSPKDLTTVPLHWIPEHWDFSRYGRLLSGAAGIDNSVSAEFLATLRNSIIAAGGSTAIAVVAAIPAAYAVSRYSGRMPVLYGMIGTYMMPPVTYVLPLYIAFAIMGVLNNVVALLIVYSTMLLPFTTWLLKSNFDAVPREIEEAARIDGAGTLAIIWNVVIPLAKPALGAAALLAFLAAWDEFFYALIFTSDLRAKTLPVAIADFAAGRITDYGLVSAVGVLAALPPTIFAVLFQRSLVSGLSAGSVKG